MTISYQKKNRERQLLLQRSVRGKPVQALVPNSWWASVYAFPDHFQWLVLQWAILSIQSTTSARSNPIQRLMLSDMTLKERLQVKTNDQQKSPSLFLSLVLNQLIFSPQRKHKQARIRNASHRLCPNKQESNRWPNTNSPARHSFRGLERNNTFFNCKTIPSLHSERSRVCLQYRSEADIRKVTRLLHMA